MRCTWAWVGRKSQCTFTNRAIQHLKEAWFAQAPTIRTDQSGRRHGGRTELSDSQKASWLWLWLALWLWRGYSGEFAACHSARIPIVTPDTRYQSPWPLLLFSWLLPIVK
jgi:hypothetical protein